MWTLIFNPRSWWRIQKWGLSWFLPRFSGEREFLHVLTLGKCIYFGTSVWSERCRAEKPRSPWPRQVLGCRCEDSRLWARAWLTAFEFTRFAHGKMIEIIILCGSHNISHRGRQSDPGAAQSSPAGYKLLKRTPECRAICERHHTIRRTYPCRHWMN